MLTVHSEQRLVNVSYVSCVISIRLSVSMLAAIKGDSKVDTFHQHFT